MAVPLAILTVTAFLPVLDNGFVDWDDERNFLRNPYYRGLGAAQVKWAWSTFWLGVYQPLAWLLLGAQSVFWKLDPRGYHLISLLLHVANAVVLYGLTMTLLARTQPEFRHQNPWTCPLAAGLATALFAVHPLRVEAVAWASCQPYLPCALFSMLSVLAYLKAFATGPAPRWGWLAGSFVLFAAALLCKAPAVSLPAVLLILDVYPLRRLGGGPGRWFGPSVRKVWWEKVPFVLLSLVFMGLAIAAKKQFDSLVSIQNYSASARIAQACYDVWFYIVKTVIPRDITAVYPLPGRLDWFAPWFLASILGTVAMSVGLFLLRRRWPGLLAAWLSYLVILAPGSGLIWVGNRLAADRYSYLSMMGGVIVAAAGLCRLGPSLWRTRSGVIGTIAVSLGSLGVLGFLTWHQCRIWRTSGTLWAHALDHGAGGSFEAHNNFAVALSHQGKLEEAVAHYRESLRINPIHVEAHINLGVLLARQGKLEEAMARYREALRINPNYAEAHNNLGVLLARQGKLEEAMVRYREALRINPNYAEAHNNLGVLLARQGKAGEAMARYREALRINPNYAEARKNLGVLLARQGKPGEAMTRYHGALRINPNPVEVHNNLGITPGPAGEVRRGDGSLPRGAANQSQQRRGPQQP